MADRYDSMTTDELLRHLCRTLDRIEKQGAPRVVNGEVRLVDVAGVQHQLDKVQQAVAAHKPVRPML